MRWSLSESIRICPNSLELLRFECELLVNFPVKTASNTHSPDRCCRIHIQNQTKHGQNHQSYNQSQTINAIASRKVNFVDLLDFVAFYREGSETKQFACVESDDGGIIDFHNEAKIQQNS